MHSPDSDSAACCQRLCLLTAFGMQCHPSLLSAKFGYNMLEGYGFWHIKRSWTNQSLIIKVNQISIISYVGKQIRQTQQGSIQILRALFKNLEICRIPSALSLIWV
jgi:hypothetical protein